ncbi:hypothetical protein [Nesterenkonia sphaerica]|uniref:Uncharacterized protein n=1 Tax=Nesterenkonia sphaerica TaxID=1804988 RepID=A0A5R9ANN4_9MICC|nr:hypothetical protein [Nesterenkonia sphaerica]TLP79447.1 hypothetical protein FEF27_02305 [Nesterenkonia sphaerica]
MSADTTEQHAANGEQLRERYLPVSRKELRRRREAELAAQHDAQEESDNATEGAGSAPAEDELARAVQATAASESDELPEEPEVAIEASPAVEPLTDDPAEDAAEETAEEADAEDTADEAELPEQEEPAPLPEPEEAPARPEEEIADAAVQQALPTQDLPSQDPPAAAQDEATKPENTAARMAETRRVRRMLKETQSIPRLSPELLAELDATNAEIAKVEDANTVDPELLKRQQSLAAKAMQANQERMRKKHAKAEQERRRRSRERPESQILTEKMVRDSLAQDPEEMQYATGQIEPVHAQGAHGLDLNKMIDATARQADQQRFLMWTAIVLGLLLLIALATVAFVLF